MRKAKVWPPSLFVAEGVTALGRVEDCIAQEIVNAAARAGLHIAPDDALFLGLPIRNAGARQPADLAGNQPVTSPVAAAVFAGTVGAYHAVAIRFSCAFARAYGCAAVCGCTRSSMSIHRATMAGANADLVSRDVNARAVSLAIAARGAASLTQ